MKLIILDRDGVINEDSDDYIKTVDEWVPVKGSLEAIARFNHAGYIVTVATNQSGIGRGYYDLETMHAMHKKMDELLLPMGGKVDAVFYCPHTPKQHCSCRKPNPGMLNDIASRFRTSLSDVMYVGDSIKDVQAARAAGAIPVLVRTGKGIRTLAKANQSELENVAVYDDLFAVANDVIKDVDYEPQQ